MRTGGLYISFSFLHLPPDRITKRRTRWKSKYSGIDQKVEKTVTQIFLQVDKQQKIGEKWVWKNARQTQGKSVTKSGQAHVLIAVNQIQTKSGQVTKTFFGTRKSKISVGNACLNSKTKHTIVSNPNLLHRNQFSESVRRNKSVQITRFYPSWENCSCMCATTILPENGLIRSQRRQDLMKKLLKKNLHQKIKWKH